MTIFSDRCLNLENNRKIETNQTEAEDLNQNLFVTLRRVKPD